MAGVAIDREAFARRAEDYYDRVLRAKLEPDHKGEYLYLDVATGDYELDADKLAAMRRARAKHPNAFLYIKRVGYHAVGRLAPRTVSRRRMRADDPILLKCKAVLKAMYGDRLKAVILYGSTARGEDTTESDVDLLVLLDGPVNAGAEIRRIWEELYPVQLECDRAISIRPADAASYERGESMLYQNIHDEGVPV
ncbi:MAG: nucleotidyltransferase domain-containing protein [Planctomycetes bacterium]|nr:nucleotidyltransferase domain-containing protein [Planctomycetota bacterium]